MYFDDWGTPHDLRNAVAYFILAALTNLGGLWFADRMNIAEKFTVAVVVVIFGLAGIISTWKELARAIDNSYDARKRADAVTPESVKLQAMHGLSDAAYVWMDHQRSDLILEVKGDASVFMIATPSGAVPADFAADFFAYDDLAALRKVGEYNGIKREWAQALTELCVNRGWAVASAGNHSALWKMSGKSRAMRAMHLEQLRELK